MKRTATPSMRKVYGQTTNAQDIQMNAVRKINSLLSSGAVSVTSGPTQSRILKQPQSQPQQKTVFVQKGECYVCDEHIGTNGTLVTEAITLSSNTKIPTKIGRIVGDAFMVIVSVDDVICKRCLTMFNHMDRLETDLERVKTNILTLINNKYGINDGSAGQTVAAAVVSNQVDVKPPPAKVQRLSGGVNATYNASRKTSNGGTLVSETDVSIPLLQPIQATQVAQLPAQARILTIGGHQDPIETQLSGMFEPNTVVRQQPQQQTINQVASSPASQKKQIKIYKCMSCDFKTTDLKQFQPHYDTCRQQNGYRCKLCKKVFTNVNALKAHNAAKHTNEFTCSICSINYVNDATLKKHMETSHPDIKTIESTTIAAASGQTLYACSICSYKAYDKAAYDEHVRKHAKMKPFKCRICSARFETRDQAGIHAKTHCPDYFKCGTCAMSFPQRELLIKHFETHKPKQQPQQQQQIQQQQIQQQQIQQQQPQIVSQELTTQKLLQDTIDEALRDTGDSGPKIHFFSCHICSLTFIQENYYKQHMETHKNNKKGGTSVAATVSASAVTSTPTSGTVAHSLIRQDQQRATATPTTILQSNQTNPAISDNDLEIMFEKMHSDKTEIDGNAAEGLVITSQESSTGGYTFNITMGQQQQQHDANENNGDLDSKNKQDGAEGLASIGIDMPVLDQSEEQQLQLQQQQQQHHLDQVKQEHSDEHQEQHQQHQEHLVDGDDQNSQSGGPVSMPSLDDDAESSQPSTNDQVPMDLDEIQNAAESGQIKFILNESGQLIQLDNHILTTDADGNQILVQGTDSEHLQQLLQSVGVLQGDGDGEQTFQMIQGENNQMILVQGDNNEAQLIDASMLNEDGHLVIQQHGDGELPEGMHVVNEDGVQVPVSIAFAQHLDDSNAEHHHHQQHEQHEQQEFAQQLEEANAELVAATANATQHEHQEHIEQQQQDQLDQKTDSEHQGLPIDETQPADSEQSNIKLEESSQDGEQELVQQQVTSAESDVTTVTTSTTAPVTSTAGGEYFNLDELMTDPK